MLLFSIFLLSTASAQTKLMMIGGGKRTTDMLEKLAEESKNGNILVITWASGDPEASFNAILKDFSTISYTNLIPAPIASHMVLKKGEFLEDLAKASGIFFTGGDQNRIMDVLKDNEIYKKLHEKYNAGYIFGGTSAGTAIMSEIMITGKGDITLINGDNIETAKGLGLVKNMIADQHFIKRQRQNRLLGLVIKYPKLYGVGIDEDTALYLENGKKASVYGKSHVLIYKSSKNKIDLTLIKKGNTFLFHN